MKLSLCLGITKRPVFGRIEQKGLYACQLLLGPQPRLIKKCALLLRAREASEIGMAKEGFCLRVESWVPFVLFHQAFFAS
jgi:hypothetical protein